MTTSLDPRLDPTRVVRAPRGSQLTCKNWVTEAAYRMIPVSYTHLTLPTICSV